MHLLVYVLSAFVLAIVWGSVYRWSSQRADQVRRFNAQDGVRLDAMRDRVPSMKIGGFDKPR